HPARFHLPVRRRHESARPESRAQVGDADLQEGRARARSERGRARRARSEGARARAARAAEKAREGQGLTPSSRAASNAARAAPCETVTAVLPPLALYVHLPWCVRKCPYCDFNSYEARGALAEDAYVAALLRDLDGDLPLAQDRPLASVFIGGGTPSLFSGAAIARLLEGVRARLPLSADIEI